ncbi:hypothetical protein PBI_NEBKISS_148 [Mycobacterium phage Nebkiss]|nr:hypothetical protein PBI_NEBKISS_148 [Mycobacterium phage Nebkiss]
MKWEWFTGFDHDGIWRLELNQHNAWVQVPQTSTDYHWRIESDTQVVASGRAASREKAMRAAEAAMFNCSTLMNNPNE